jgi:cytochrome b pre-mRNA-processing protein 3
MSARMAAHEVRVFARRGGWRRERVGFALYTAAAQAARDPVFYAAHGVPDTLDGRFDLMALFVSLLIRRLRRLPDPGPATAQAVFDAMFADMDHQLREMGVGDLSVPKRVREMWEALHGRALAYEAALDAGDEAALAEAIGRNVWRGAPAPGAAALAAIALRVAAALDRQPEAALLRGQARLAA